MIELFQDEMTAPRQKLYWQLFADRITIDEWEQACEQAMRRETFHKVPLPAQLFDYVQEYRGMQAQRAHEAARITAAAQRIALEASPEWVAAQAQQAQAKEQWWVQYRAWRESLSREEQIALGLLNPPDRKRWRLIESDDVADTGTMVEGESHGD